jgi:hypothetical protein
MAGNPWLMHVAKVKKSMPKGTAYKDVLMEAKKSYVPVQPKGLQKGKGQKGGNKTLKKVVRGVRRAVAPALLFNPATAGIGASLMAGDKLISKTGY